MAGAAAVELLISLLHHRQRGGAPAPQQVSAAAAAAAEAGERTPSSGGTILGALPHQVRGYIASFETLTLFSEQFPACCACSPNVVREYRSRSVLSFFSECFFCRVRKKADSVLTLPPRQFCRGLDFLCDVFDSPDSHALLERISGAAAMVKAMEEMDDLDFDFPSDEEAGEDS